MTFAEGDADVDGVTRDTFVEESTPGDNQGTHADFHVEDGGVQVSLLEFDVSALPDEATVVDVELDLSTASSPNIECMVQFFVLGEEWEAATANGSMGISNWNERTASSSWSSPGAGSGAHGSTVVGELDSPAGGESFTVQIDPDLVQQWRDDPGSNNGLLIAAAEGSGACYGWFMSSDANNPSERPLLRVEFQ